MSDHEYKFYQPRPAPPRGDPRARAGARRALAGRAPAPPAPAGLHRRPADPVPRSQGPGTGADTHGHSVLAAQAAGTLVVVKTPPGEAHPVARAVDESGLPGVVGTIAGDDTVFIATPSPAAALRVERRLRVPLSAIRQTRRARA